MESIVKFPRGYTWLIETKLIGFEPFSQLQPWFYVQEAEMFWANEKWPNNVLNKNLLVFARRQDCE